MWKMKATVGGFVMSGALFLGLGADPVAAATVGTGYDETDVQDLLWATEYLDLVNPGDLQHAGVAVINFILRVSEDTEPACELGYRSVIDTNGIYRYASIWSNEELAMLDWVADHYCISREQAQRLGATLLAFFAGLDASSKGIEIVKPPIPTPPEVVPIVVGGTRTTTVVLVESIPNDYQVAEIAHIGGNSFRVRGLDSAGDLVQVLVDRSGGYLGRVIVEAPEQIRSLTVEADGEWTVTFLPVVSATRFGVAQSAEGTTDDVLVLEDPVGEGQVLVGYSHEGAGDFVVQTFGADGLVEATIVDEPGNQKKYTLQSKAVRFIEVTADGPWSLSVATNPLAPGGLTARQDGSAVVLDWIAPSFDAAPPIAGYLVEYSVDGGNVWSPVTTMVGAETSILVESGDDLESIAFAYGVTVEALIAANGLLDPDPVYPGQELQIPLAPGRSAGTMVRVGGFNRGSDATFRVAAVDAEGFGQYAEEVSPPSPCEASTGVLADLRLAVMENQVNTADYEGFITAHIPKATAALLMAEVHCLAVNSKHDRSQMDRLGEQLLAWPDDYPSERYGWGLPFAWDAFGDGSTNPANTVYAISTALSIKALLDWSEVSGEPLRSRILLAVDRALEEWTEPDAMTDSQPKQFVYSLSGFDNEHDVYNSSAMLAGQMQRASDLGLDASGICLCSSDDRYELRFMAVSQVMQGLIINHREELMEAEVVVRPGEDVPAVAARFGVEADAVFSVNGLTEADQVSVGTSLRVLDAIDSGWFWNYSSAEFVANDLTHAGYIVDGIATYLQHHGVLAPLFPTDKIFGHLLTFLSNGTVSEAMLPWPVWRSSELTVPAWRLPRLYEIGWALNVAAGNRELLAPLEEAACDLVLRYRQDGQEFLKYPRNSDLGGLQNPEVHEYMSYLYLGLTRSHCSYTFESGMVNQSGDNYQLVPLTTLGADIGLLSDLWIDTDTGRARLEMGQDLLDLPFEGIPIGLASKDGTVLAVVREVPLSVLSFVRWEAGVPTQSVQLPGQDSVNLMLRAMHRDSEFLYLVVYDNQARENRLQKYSWDSLDLLTEWVLPSIEPAAGHTYEMEPPLHFVAGNDGMLRLVGGTLYGTLVGDTVTYGRLVDCSKALEAVAGTGSQLIVLCEANDYVVGNWPVRQGGFSLSTVDGEHLESSVIEVEGVPYDLRFNPKLQTVEWLDSATAGLAPFLRYEIGEGQNSGTLELGTNNWEGRVAWSQIYYLDALLDLIRISSYWALNEDVGNLVGPITDRLRIEMELLETVLSAEGMASKAFTVDRSQALFAVQTSRLAVLFQRYLEVFPASGRFFPELTQLSHASFNLDGHIEVIDEGGVAGWLPAGQAQLMWPKESAFPFDGLNVPFNHQNEWALAILEANQDWVPASSLEAANEILNFFYGQTLLPEGGVFPGEGIWPYWWGTAWDGWNAEDDVSINMPSYVGDHGNSWITFRSIDTEAMVAWSDHLDGTAGGQLLDSVVAMVWNGDVLPQIAAALVEHGVLPAISDSAFGRFGRASSPSEFPAMVWAHVLRGR